MLVPVVAFVVLLCGLPESPRWLAARHKYDDASRYSQNFVAAVKRKLRCDGIQHEMDSSLRQKNGVLSELFTPELE